MGKDKNIERKIRLSAFFIYAIVIVLCAVLFMYIYSQKERVGAQKQNIETNRQTLALTNTLIAFVNHAQANANLYIMSKDPKYILLFKENIDMIQQYIDSLRPHSSLNVQESILNEIEPLLKEKIQTISELNEQFDHYNFVDSVNKKLRMRELALLNEVIASKENNQTTTIVTSTYEPDTIRKGFFKRLAEAFVPTKTPAKGRKDQKEVTVTTDSLLKSDTVAKPNDLSVLSDLLTIAQTAGKKYTQQIVAIEKQVATLMVSDHEISRQLSHLLIDLHQQTIDSTMKEIQTSEQLIRENYFRSIIGSIIALVLILIAIIFIIKNVNKSRELRLAIGRANVRIQETYESRHKLLLSISHDVKTPINSILGYLELSEQGHVITPKEFSTMRYSGRFVLNLMENLLDFSHLDQGLKYKSEVEFSLYNLCAEVRDLLAPLILQKKLWLDAQFNFDKTLHLYSDEFKIRRIIINILSNAIKYTTKGNVQFYVSYSNGQIVFQLNDTGKGIPAEHLDNIFDAFKRVEDNNSMATGNGFGLFVAKGLTDLLEGQITIRSTVNVGTQVEVLIPAKVVDGIMEKTTYKKLLVIDDDVIFSAMLQKMLLNLGHSVYLCHSLETWEELADRITEYDAVLTDADMITFSGKDILRKMQEKKVKAPVILMSGQYRLNNREAKKMGFNGFLKKPLTMASLQELFGGSGEISNTLPSLEELFGDDKEVIRKILKAFMVDTNKHIALLEQAINEDDFLKARQVCHKMYPMFVQMKVDKGIVILAGINEWREEPAGLPSTWKEDIRSVLTISKELLMALNHKI